MSGQLSRRARRRPGANRKHALPGAARRMGEPDDGLPFGLDLDPDLRASTLA